MGRYTGPACRLCRREGLKLFLKGDRCNMAKCPIDTGRPPPGMHGVRRTKASDYARQFREKQRLQRYYGLQDEQLRLFFARAAQQPGITGETLLRLLELRLDNLVYRFGFSPSRRAARQFVRHQHLSVNGHRASVPSMILKPGDRVAVKDRKHSRALAKKWLEANEGKTLSPWLQLDRENYVGEVLREPTRAEIGPFVNEQLVVELCSK
ncbi:MAG: 30S ribosomal protein S4 [Lentisphaerae bacterium]|nr:30S ribosomal protein S4 [Lentisphaerota bacterium]